VVPGTMLRIIHKKSFSENRPADFENRVADWKSPNGTKSKFWRWPNFVFAFFRT